MATRYRHPTKAPQTAWAVHIDRYMRENGLSQQGAFELAHKALGLGPKSRTAFLPFLEAREPNESEAQALASVFGWPSPDDDPPAVPVDDAVAAAIDRQTDVMRELLAEFRQSREDRALLHDLAAQVHELRTRVLAEADADRDLDALEAGVASTMSPRPTRARPASTAGSGTPRRSRAG